MQPGGGAVQVDVLPDESAIDARVLGGVPGAVLHGLALLVDHVDKRDRGDEGEVVRAVAHAAGEAAQVVRGDEAQDVRFGVPEERAVGAADVQVDFLPVDRGRRGALARVGAVEAVRGPQ